jgi:subtilisin-like proprotein convertase family protein
MLFANYSSCAAKSASNIHSIKIPNNFPIGVVSEIPLDNLTRLKAVQVEVHIAHPRIGDLLVQLQCPDGHLVTLHNHHGGRQRNLNTTYSVKACENLQVVGHWQLRISDNKPLAEGSLLSWKLHFIETQSSAPIFRLSAIKDWYLIGNAITPGSDNIQLHVDVSGKAVSMQSAIDAGVNQPLIKSAAGFDGSIDISTLTPGMHTLSLWADGKQVPLATLNFHRSHPLYVLLTTDWDASDSVDSILRLHETLHLEHPGLKFTHFFGPYTFTDPNVSSARQKLLDHWMIRLRETYHDEIGLHIHPFCNFVNTVRGVHCRFKPSDSYSKGDTSGYTVLSSAYSENEFLKLLKAADALFVAHGLGKPTAFRTGSWAAGSHTLKALVEDGFVADSSANNWARIEESRHDGNGHLYTWNRQHWGPINDTSQPYYPNIEHPALPIQPALPILEIPDNGSLVDYVTGTEMINIFNLNWLGVPLAKPATFVFGFHPVSYSMGFHNRIEKALAHFDSYLASNGDGPVVYETLSNIEQVFTKAPK